MDKLSDLLADPQRNRCQICNHPLTTPRDLRAGTHYKCSHKVPVNKLDNPNIMITGPNRFNWS
jgi:hypothetical protein